MFQSAIDFPAAFCTVDLSDPLAGWPAGWRGWQAGHPCECLIKVQLTLPAKGRGAISLPICSAKLCLTCSFVPIEAAATQAATDALILISLHSA